MSLIPLTGKQEAARREHRVVAWTATAAAGGGFLVTAIIYFPVLWLALMLGTQSPLVGIPGRIT